MSRQRFAALALIAALVLVPALVFAEGPVLVGSCTFEWDPVTTYSDGVVIPSGIGLIYTLYTSATPTPVPVPGTSSANVITTTPTWNCSNKVGQVYVWQTARIGSGPESALSVVFPFVVSTGVPAAPKGQRVR